MSFVRVAVVAVGVDACGEFDWGGTTVTIEHRRPKVGTAGRETSCGVQGHMPA